MVLRYVLLLTLLVPLMSTSGAIETFVNDHDHYAHQDAHIILRYFRSRGRAESIRLILEYLQVPYEEIRYTSTADGPDATWPAAKKAGIESGLFPFGQLPSLSFCPDGNKTSDDCFHLVQSHSIMRFLDRWYGTYGTEDKKWLVDVITGGVEDFYKKYTTLVYDKEAEAKKEAYFATVVPLWIGHFERLKTAHSKDHVFMTGSTATHADFFLYYVLDVHMRLNPECLDSFPQMKLFTEVVEAIPAIQRYIHSSRRAKTPNGNSAFLDNPKNPAVVEETEL
jgi:glutathione S-transferase